MSLTLVSMVLYPLHMVLFNFTEMEGRRQIVQAPALIAHLPAHFRKPTSQEKHSLNNETGPNVTSRLEFLLAFHECKNVAVKPLINVAEKVRMLDKGQ